jgi:hypothetical protein
MILAIALASQHWALLPQLRKVILMDTYEEYKLKKRIDQLELEISQLMESNTNLLLKLETTTAMLVKYYDKADQHWFDQTVSI